MRLKYATLPPMLKKQVDRQLQLPRRARPEPDTSVPKKPTPRPRRMTRTEEEYEAILVEHYGRENVHYEALTLRLRNGHKYTPDFVVTLGRGDIALFEVKGSYRLGSYQRARMAFDQARIDWPMFYFRWAEKRNGNFVEDTP